MESYSYIAELVVLPIILTIMISLRRDCYTKSVHYRYLNTMYHLAFFSSIVTFSTCFFNNPLDSKFAIICGYIVDTLYFMLVPSVAIMYALYVQFTSSGILRLANAWKKMWLMLIPYAAYLIFLLANLGTGLVFTMTAQTGYVRGPLYELPYPLVSLYGILIVISIAKNFKHIPRESSYVILITAITALTIVVVLFYNQGIILTGLLSTLCVLGIHLHTLNNGKKEDLLTGTQNRLAFLTQLAKEIDSNKVFSIYVISVRGMKHVNEQYGLRIGDKKLFNIAEILHCHVRREFVFRYSGDEFAILLPFSEKKMPPVIKHLMQDFERSTKVENNVLPIDVEMMRVDYPTFGSHVGDLIAVIDYGIHLLKEQKESTSEYLYDISVADTMRKYHAMIFELNTAIEQHRFEIHYQPIYHIPTGKFTHAEALIRLRKQDGTLIHPNDFIEVANDTGLIVKMTYQLLDQVCSDLRMLLNQQPNTTFEAVSINVPYAQFREPDMEERFLSILAKHRISPRQIKIEVTERTMVEDFEMMNTKMNRLIAKGFQFELDDFGIGYSNLQMSITFPIEIIKLDRSILLTASASETGRSFFQCIIAGINSTNRKILVEGIETQEQLNWATACHCEYVQGYLFSKPVCFERFFEFLHENAS